MQANQHSVHRYREVAVKTANPLQLVVLLYDAALQSLQEAQEHIRRKSIADRVRCINHSISVISELQAALNLKEGGEIARSLDQLYSYMRQRIFKANLEQRPEPLAEVIKLLENLRSAWSELAAKAQKEEASEHSKSSKIFDAASAPAAQVGALNISG